VAAAVRVGVRAFGIEAVDVEVETWTDLDTGPRKVGLGGSAAVVTAVLAALQTFAETGDDRHRLASLGVAAHRLAQGGGSGADVVAATLGGLLWIRDLDARTPPTTVSECLGGAAFRAERLDLPPGLALEVVATGEAASTGPRVRRFVDRASGRGGLGRGSAELLRAWSRGAGAASSGFRDACRTRDAVGALAALRSGRAHLGRLGALTGIRVWTPRLRLACDALCGDPKVVIKPSGAGGGDCAVALAVAERCPALREAWRRSGLQPLEVEASLRGVTANVEAEGASHG
jgi:phosphomevalonate kinase